MIMIALIAAMLPAFGEVTMDRPMFINPEQWNHLLLYYSSECFAEFDAYATETLSTMPDILLPHYSFNSLNRQTIDHWMNEQRNRDLVDQFINSYVSRCRLITFEPLNDY